MIYIASIPVSYAQFCACLVEEKMRSWFFQSVSSFMASSIVLGLHFLSLGVTS